MINLQKNIRLILFLFCLHIKGVASLNSPSPLNTLRFQENKGQIADQNFRARPDILFSGCDGNLVFHLMKDGIQYQITKIKSLTKANKISGASLLAARKFEFPDEVLMNRIELKWLNCSSNANVLKGTVCQGFDNYYMESCSNGALEVKSFKSITYQNIYKGIDLIWYEKNGHLKYDYNLAPGADYHQIEIEVKGTETIRINEFGQLILKTAIGEIIEEAPLIVQEGKVLKASWHINGNVLSFQIKDLNPLKACTIDPLIRLWGTYYGGNGYDWVGTSYTDNKGNLFACGATTSSNFSTMATVGAYQTSFGGGATWGDNYIVKFNASGQRLWGTYFGGSGTDFSNCCVVDANGDVYISGGTSSSNTAVMSTPGCQQSIYGGGSGTLGDAFLAKFNTQGARLWSTYIGGTGDEWTYGIANDFQNNIFITGHTGSPTSSSIASAACHQANFGGGFDSFLMKFNPQGLRLWGTYYGGTNNDEACGCITDAQGNVYIGGITSSTNAIATPASYQFNYSGGVGNSVYGIGDAFMVKFNSAGVRQWGTYYGGSGDEYIYYCAVDAVGDIYFSGSTSSSTGTNIVTAGSHQTTYGGGPSDALILKFNNSGQRIWGTYYGGLGIEDWVCCVCDNNAGKLYISGITSSGTSTNIASSCAYQGIFGGGTKDAFLAKFTLQGLREYGTYYGGLGTEDWSGVVIDGLSSVYLTGETTAASASVISSAGAHQTIYGGGTYDGFIAKFDACFPITPSATTNTVYCKSWPAVLNASQNCGLNWYSDSTLNNLIYSGGSFTSNPLFHDTVFYLVDVSCGIHSNKAVAHVSLVAGPTISVSATPSIICKGEHSVLMPNGAIYYNWSNASGQYSISVSPSVSTVFSVSGSMSNGGCAGRSTVTVTVNECLGIDNNTLFDNFDFLIYPNPSNGSVTLSGTQSFSWHIINELGEEMASQRLTDQLKSEVTLKLPPGVYLAMAYNNRTCIVKKLIISGNN